MITIFTYVSTTDICREYWGEVERELASFPNEE